MAWARAASVQFTCQCELDSKYYMMILTLLTSTYRINNNMPFQDMDIHVPLSDRIDPIGTLIGYIPG